MKGIITDVTNLGTIVQLTVKPDGEELEQTIPMDWRMYKNFLEDVRCRYGRLFGLHIEYKDDTIQVIE